MCKGDNISIIPFSNFAAENFTTHISQSTFKSSLPAVEYKKNGGGGGQNTFYSLSKAFNRKNLLCNINTNFIFKFGHSKATFCQFL